MIPTPRRDPEAARKPRRALASLLFATLVASACASVVQLPPPRPLVVRSGARLSADPDTLQKIYDWYVPQDEAIEQDPSFWLVSVEGEEDTYPWETLILVDAVEDTARYQYVRSNPDIVGAYNIYAHLHLMKKLGRLQEWLPDFVNVEGYALEREFVSRMSDAWLLGRTVFDAAPHALMDELIYAKSAGHLDAFIFTARPNDFAQEREAWLREHPLGLEEYRSWFRQTLGGDPPGVRTPARE